MPSIRLAALASLSGASPLGGTRWGIARPISLIGAFAASLPSLSLVRILVLVSPVARSGFPVVHRLLREGFERSSWLAAGSRRMALPASTLKKTTILTGMVRPIAEWIALVAAPALRGSAVRLVREATGADYADKRRSSLQDGSKISRLPKRARFPKDAKWLIASIRSEAVYFPVPHRGGNARHIGSPGHLFVNRCFGIPAPASLLMTFKKGLGFAFLGPIRPFALSPGGQSPASL